LRILRVSQTRSTPLQPDRGKRNVSAKNRAKTGTNGDVNIVAPGYPIVDGTLVPSELSDLILNLKRHFT
jgi:hypothetical protein